jgi:hypothetical protein
MVHETHPALQLHGSTKMRLDPLAEVRFVKLQQTWSSAAQVNYAATASPLSCNRQANSRTVLQCASGNASVRMDPPSESPLGCLSLDAASEKGKLRHASCQS